MWCPSQYQQQGHQSLGEFHNKQRNMNALHPNSERAQYGCILFESFESLAANATEAMQAKTNKARKVLFAISEKKKRRQDKSYEHMINLNKSIPLNKLLRKTERTSYLNLCFEVLRWLSHFCLRGGAPQSSRTIVFQLRWLL